MAQVGAGFGQKKLSVMAGPFNPFSLGRAPLPAAPTTVKAPNLVEIGAWTNSKPQADEGGSYLVDISPCAVEIPMVQKLRRVFRHKTELSTRLVELRSGVVHHEYKADMVGSFKNFNLEVIMGGRPIVADLSLPNASSLGALTSGEVSDAALKAFTCVAAHFNDSKATFTPALGEYARSARQSAPNFSRLCVRAASLASVLVDAALRNNDLVLWRSQTPPNANRIGSVTEFIAAVVDEAGGTFVVPTALIDPNLNAALHQLLYHLCGSVMNVSQDNGHSYTALNLPSWPSLGDHVTYYGTVVADGGPFSA